MSSIEEFNNNVLSVGESVLDDSVEETKTVFIGVGAQYQAVCPELQPDDERPELREKAVLVWAPTDSIADEKLEEYLTVAKGQHGYTEEQALALLRYDKYDLALADEHLNQFTPAPDGWSIDDTKLFEKTLHLVGKDFRKIQEILPDKSICSLVEYYYTRSAEKKAKEALKKKASNKRKKLKKYSDGIENDLDLICGCSSVENSENPEKKRRIVGS